MFGVQGVDFNNYLDSRYKHNNGVIGYSPRFRAGYEAVSLPNPDMSQKFQERKEAIEKERKRDRNVAIGVGTTAVALLTAALYFANPARRAKAAEQLAKIKGIFKKTPLPTSDTVVKKVNPGKQYAFKNWHDLFKAYREEGLMVPKTPNLKGPDRLAELNRILNESPYKASVIGFPKQPVEEVVEKVANPGKQYAFKNWRDMFNAYRTEGLIVPQTPNLKGQDRLAELNRIINESPYKASVIGFPKQTA